MFMVGVVSIRLIQSRENFETATIALYYLDALLSDCFLEDQHWKLFDSKHVKIIKQLMDKRCKEYDIHPYICNTFDCFVRSKAEIYIDLYEMDKNNKFVVEIRNMIMHPLRYQNLYKDNPEGGDYDLNNLFKSKLLNVFKYTKKLIINAAKGGKSYVISLIALLSLIKESSLQHITIILGYKDYLDKLNKLYVISEEMKQKYRNAGYSISNLKRNTGLCGNYISCDVILS